MRIFRSAILLVFSAACCVGSPVSSGGPIATLALSELPVSGRLELKWASVTFASEQMIAAGLCYEGQTGPRCLLSLIRWEQGNLKRVAETRDFAFGTSVHPASRGRILAIEDLSPVSLYSDDLSTRRQLAKGLSRFVSPSGDIVSQWAPGSWKLYRLTDTAEPFRAGSGDLLGVSDEFALIQDGKIIKVEGFDGKQVGSFAAQSGREGSYASVGILGSTSIYLDDCRDVQILKLDGSPLRELRTHKGCSEGDTGSSIDGSRMLFDFADYKPSGLGRVIEGLRSVTTLGMSGTEDVNRETVEVLDILNGNVCFKWRHRFPKTYSRVRSAAISPSGRFVAIVEANTLSIYRVPDTCGERTGLSGK